LLGEVVLPLIIESSSSSISLVEGNVDIEVLEENAEGIVKNLFATTLLGATIQDGGIRARSSENSFSKCYRQVRPIISHKNSSCTLIYIY